MNEVFYASLADTARSLLTSFGKPVTFKRIEGEEKNPVTGEIVHGFEADFVANAVLTEIPDRLVNGTRIKQGDRHLICEAGVEPLMTDRPELLGWEWSIIEIATIAPAGIPVAYRLQVRG